MILHLLRGAFILLTASVAALYLLTSQSGEEDLYFGFTEFVVMLTVTLSIAGLFVAADIFLREKKLSAASGVFLGLIAGLIAAYALSFVVDLFGVLTMPEITAEPSSLEYDQQMNRQQAYENLLEGVKVFIGLAACYISISLVLQTKDDFRFVIPYVEFAKEIRGNRPTILDTSVIIDGRILDIIETRVLQGTLVVPRFVLAELQTVADSADKMKRARGRRGLDILKKLQDGQLIDVQIDEREVEGADVDQKLISLAEYMRGRVMTNDYNLNKIATLRGVEVINLNDLAKALRPVVLPGEHLHVKLIKPGENPAQGVGYLDDGTMVVAEDGRQHVGQMVDIVVTSTLQTSAGRMIFGRFRSVEDDGEQDQSSREGVVDSEGGGAARGADQAAAKAEPGESGGAGETAAHPRRTRGASASSGRNPRRSGR